MIKGVTIKLYTKEQTGTDAFNRPVYSESSKNVDNVLIGQPTDDDILSTLNLTGRKVIYTLGIPKGDTNDWIDKVVEFWGQKYRTIGAPIQGIEEMIPLDWNKKVRVELVNGE